MRSVMLTAYNLDDGSESVACVVLCFTEQQWQELFELADALRTLARKRKDRACALRVDWMIHYGGEDFVEACCEAADDANAWQRAFDCDEPVVVPTAALVSHQVDLESVTGTLRIVCSKRGEIDLEWSFIVPDEDCRVESASVLLSALQRCATAEEE